MSSFQRYLDYFRNKYLPVPNREIEYQSKDAKFCGWQETAKGEKVALFNIITQKHPRLGFYGYGGDPSKSEPASSCNTCQTSYITEASHQQSSLQIKNELYLSPQESQLTAREHFVISYTGEVGMRNLIQKKDFSPD